MKISREDMLLFNALESVSGVQPRDCVVSGNTISYVIKSKDMGKAIGKNAINVKLLRKKIKKNIEIFEECETPEKFVEKALDISVKESVSENREDKNVLQLILDIENKKKVMQNIGKLKRVKVVVERNYKLDDIKIK